MESTELRLSRKCFGELQEVFAAAGMEISDVSQRFLQEKGKIIIAPQVSQRTEINKFEEDYQSNMAEIREIMEKMGFRRRVKTSPVKITG